MATPIKETPVLKGKDAREFMAKISSPTKREAISDHTRQRMRIISQKNCLLSPISLRTNQNR